MQRALDLAAQGIGQFVGALSVLAIGEGLAAVDHANLVAEIQLGPVAKLGERLPSQGRPSSIVPRLICSLRVLA